jgi:hypothetical protein
MVGTDKRITLVAEDLVKHWEARYAAMEAAAELDALLPAVLDPAFKVEL